jgi:predicted hydrocarbon binding protein
MRGAATIDPQRRFLRFQFDEDATLADWKEAQEIFQRLSEETGIIRALVDIRKQGNAGARLELFEFGRSIPSGMAFAVLSARGRDDHEFVETVAINRGKNVCLFFGPEEEAIEWLAGRQ